MEARSGTAAGGLLRDVEKTPSKEGVDDASYLYSEESLLDYLKLFKFNSEKDYAPLLITAGFDCVARLAGEAKDYVGLGIPLGHALGSS